MTRRVTCEDSNLAFADVQPFTYYFNHLYIGSTIDWWSVNANS
jgi:hypothetical protein